MSDQVRAVIYARISTNNGSQDAQMQIRELQEYCQRRGWAVVGEYIDEGYSGAKDSRPALDKMMRDAHRHRFSTLVVWKFDRYARSVSHLLSGLETFRTLGIQFVSLTEQLDSGTPAGKMMFTVLGAVAELERDLIRERVKAGMRNARAKGKHIGRPPLRRFSDEEVNQIRATRLQQNISIRKLAVQHGTTQWMVKRVLTGA